MRDRNQTPTVYITVQLSRKTGFHFSGSTPARSAVAGPVSSKLPLASYCSCAYKAFNFTRGRMRGGDILKINCCCSGGAVQNGPGLYISAEDQPGRGERALWHCLHLICVSYSKLAFTLVIKRTAGIRRWAATSSVRAIRSILLIWLKRCPCCIRLWSRSVMLLQRAAACCSWARSGKQPTSFQTQRRVRRNTISITAGSAER